MNRIIRRLAIVLSLAAALSLALVPGCSFIQSGVQRDLNAARDKWEKSSIEDYEYHLRILCFCPPSVTFPVIIRVENGVNVSVEYAQEPKEVTNDYFKPVDTIDKVFDVIQKAIDNKVDSLEVEYDSTYGYPKSIAIDPVRNAVDEETSYFIETFIPSP